MMWIFKKLVTHLQEHCNYLAREVFEMQILYLILHEIYILKTYYKVFKD